MAPMLAVPSRFKTKNRRVQSLGRTSHTPPEQLAITSVVGATGNPGQANYVAAKARITGMVKAIAAEYAKRGVTANCVAPGFIVTPMTDKLNDKQREGILAKIPASRAGTVEDVAAAVAFLAANEAGYVTGQTLHVNGGMAMI